MQTYATDLWRAMAAAEYRGDLDGGAQLAERAMGWLRAGGEPPAGMCRAVAFSLAKAAFDACTDAWAAEYVTIR